MSDLPPKPPMRSMPRMKRAMYCVRTRSSSFSVGPSARNFASSSSMAFSTAASATPGLASAWIVKTLPISRTLT